MESTCWVAESWAVGTWVTNSWVNNPAWESTFYIGTSIGTGGDFATLKSLFANLNKPVDPDWTFSPFSANFDQSDGGRAGVGLPRATWTWQHRKDVHLEVLRTICPGVSAQVYIRTPTNATISGASVWHTYLCQMIWTSETEDKQAGYTLEFLLEFRKLVEQEEI